MVPQNVQSGNDFLWIRARLTGEYNISRNADRVVMSETAQNEANEKLAREIDDLLRRVDALPTVDPRPEAEILGYGDGAPG
jgi:hypothetical protein